MKDIIRIKKGPKKGTWKITVNAGKHLTLGDAKGGDTERRITLTKA